MGAKESHLNTSCTGMTEWSYQTPIMENVYIPRTPGYQNRHLNYNEVHLNRLQNMYNGGESISTPNIAEKVAGDVKIALNYTQEKSRTKKCSGDDREDLNQADSELDSCATSQTLSKFSRMRKVSFLQSVHSFVDDDEHETIIDESSSSSDSECSISPESFLARVRPNSEKRLGQRRLIQNHRFYVSPSPSTSTLSSGLEIADVFVKQTLTEIQRRAKKIEILPAVTEPYVEQSERVEKLSIGTVSSEISLLPKRRVSDWEQDVSTTIFNNGHNTKWESPRLSTTMGFQMLSDGEAVFTAFLRMHGDQESGWKQLIKRSERVLKGLQRQHDCQIKLYENATQLHAMTVHKLCIQGASKRIVLRCKNALPLYITEFLITSHDSHHDFERHVAPQHSVY